MTKLKKCPLCGSDVTLTEDTQAQWPSPVIDCPCGLQKLLPWAAERPGGYERLTKQLIAQWNSRPLLEEAHEALRAYNVISGCPGILIEPGAVSGCRHFDPMDCPTCAVVDAAEKS